LSSIGCAAFFKVNWPIIILSSRRNLHYAQNEGERKVWLMCC
jgi:hypothetical protein